MHAAFSFLLRSSTRIVKLLGSSISFHHTNCLPTTTFKKPSDVNTTTVRSFITFETQLCTSRFEMNKYSIKKSHKGMTLMHVYSCSPRAATLSHSYPCLPHDDHPRLLWILLVNHQLPSPRNIPLF